MKVLDKVVLRVPSYSIDLLDEITYSKIEQIFYNSFFLKAILIASPSLYDAIQRYKNQELNNKKTKNLFNSIACYLIRMSSRTSPFGLFSRCIVGTRNSNLFVSFNPNNIDYTIKPDCLLLNQLVRLFLQNEQNISHVIFYPNTTLTKQNNNFKFIELKDTIKIHGYEVSQVELTSMLMEVVSYCKVGKSFNDICEYIINKGFERSEAKEYLKTMIHYQILISELEHIIVEENTFEKTIDYLQRNKNINEHIIHNIFQKFKQLNNEKNKTEHLINELRNQVKNNNIKDSNLVYVQIIDNTSYFNLQSSIYENLLEGIQFLKKILPKTENKVLNEFKKKFSKRYGDQNVSLKEVLDPIIGIGYPDDTFFKKDSSLLDNVHIRNKLNPENSYSIVDEILIQKLQEYYQENLKEIRISEQDLKENYLKGKYVNSYFALTEIVLINNELYIYLKSVAGSSAAGLFSRFGIADCKIQELVHEIIEEENALLSENQIFAEVLHTSPFTSPNVISRNHIRDYEILYLANSSKKESQKIFISDLYIRLKNNHFVLFSKKLQKEIIPRLTTAYNFSLSSLPIFRFLSDLQFDDVNTTLNFRKGSCFSQLTYFPRVVYKNCILSLSTWKLKVSEILKIYNLGDCPKFYSEIEVWRIKNRLPQKVCLLENNTSDLVIKWDNYICIGIVISEVRGKSTIDVQEFLFDNGNSPVLDKEGRQYTNEFIFSIIDKK